MIYAGIGSTHTPPEILQQMENIGTRLARLGCILRSGGAEGADLAFERGCDAAQGRKEIFLPWPRFNGRTEDVVLPPRETFLAVSGVDPAWEECAPMDWAMLARDCQQILGQNLDNPVIFVVCWYVGGVGGTEQAVGLATRYGIPVFNLREFGILERLEQVLCENLIS